MKKSGCSPERAAFALRQAQGGMPVSEICRKMGVSEQILCQAQNGLSYCWKKQRAGMGVAEGPRRQSETRPSRLPSPSAPNSSARGSEWHFGAHSFGSNPDVSCRSR